MPSPRLSSKKLEQKSIIVPPKVQPILKPAQNEEHKTPHLKVEFEADLDENITNSNLKSGKKKKKKKTKKKTGAFARDDALDIPQLVHDDQGIGGSEFIPNRSSMINNNANDLHIEDITDNVYVHEHYTEINNHGGSHVEEQQAQSSSDPNHNQNGGSRNGNGNQHVNNGSSLISVNRISVKMPMTIVNYNDSSV